MSEPAFINSAVVRVPEPFVLRHAPWRMIEVGVRYGLLIHPHHGPVLIDTGYGPRATEGPRSSLMQVYGAILRPRLVRQHLPIAELAARGYAATDVKRIIVTHFHPDHIAALRDFPNARFITSSKVWARISAMSALTRIHNGIFRELLPDDFAARMLPLEECPTVGTPLGRAHDLFGDGTCLALDLPGHAIGHFGLLWPGLETPLFYAVDATWLSDALQRLPLGPAHVVYSDSGAMRRSADLVHRARAEGWRVVLCHDRIG